MVRCPYCHNSHGFRIAFECTVYYSTETADDLFLSGWKDMGVGLPLLSSIDSDIDPGYFITETEKRCAAKAECFYCHKESYVLIEPFLDVSVFTTKKFKIAKLFKTRAARDKARLKLQALKTMEVRQDENN